MEQNGIPGNQHWRNQLDAETLFFAELPLKITSGLHNQLPVSEDGFCKVSATAWKDGRAYYLYGAIDEVTKVGIASLRWGEFLSGPDEPVLEDPKERRIDRLCLESVFDEQLMWQRKLTEWLTNLVCFTDTNSQECYRLFLAAEAYDCQIANIHDFKTYYACNSGNLHVGLGWTKNRLSKEIDNICQDKCWFLNKEVFKKLPNRPGQMFASMAKRLPQALEKASQAEQLALGVSYVGGFGTASRAIHPVIADISPPTTVDDVKATLVRIAILCLHIINRVCMLALLTPSGLAQQAIAYVCESEEAGAILTQKHRPDYEPGDLILAMGHLAEVTERHDSLYRTQSYSVRFLVDCPIPEMLEDCVPAKWTSVILRKSWSREYLRNAWSRRPEAKELIPLLDSKTEEELTSILRQPLIFFVKNGIPLEPLIPRAPVALPF